MSINVGGGELRELKPRILVIGVGGAGGNAINEMIDAGVIFVAAAGNNNQRLGIGANDPDRLNYMTSTVGSDPRAEFPSGTKPCGHRDWMHPQGIGFDSISDFHPVICCGAMEEFIGIIGGAATYEEGQAGYSNNGPGIDIWAPADETLSAGIWDTDETNYVRRDDANFADRFFNGTSAAAPVVTGLVALFLETNPSATSADVKNPITGEIITNGDLRIDGTLKGNVHTKGLLVLGETGIIEGEVVCQNALIAGTVKAKIQVAELLSLKAKASLHGDIVTNKLSIEPGANFTGSCSMGASVKNIKLRETNDKSKEKTVKSVNNGIRSSVRKLNPILKSIVGKKVDVAIRDLQFSEKRITRDVRKTISSAVANAENNFQYDIDKLIVKEAYCGKKIVMKRFRPRAKGRAAPILKPWSTVTIILSEAKQMEKHGAKS